MLACPKAPADHFPKARERFNFRDPRVAMIALMAEMCGARSAIEVFNQVTSATTLVTTAETTVVTATLPRTNTLPVEGISATGATPGVKISGVINVTTGTTVTSVSIRVRTGSLVGTIVGAAQQPTAGASGTWQFSYEVLDTTNAVPNGTQYFVTVQQNGAGTNGTVNYASVSLTPVANVIN